MVAAFSWRYAWSLDSGWIPGLLGIKTDPLTQTGWSYVAVIITEVWKTTPFMALLLLAGLALVPDELHEAAKVDGASAWQRFWRITVPLMKPADPRRAAVPHARRVPDLRLGLHPSPAGQNNTETVSILGYNQLLNRLNLGLGSTVSVLIFVMRRDHRVHLRQGLRDLPGPAEGGDVVPSTGREKATWGVINVVVILAALIPVLWIISLSFKDPSTIADGNFFPTKWSTENYSGIFQTSEFTDALRNSIGIALITTRDRGDAGRAWPPTRSRG